MSEMSLEERVSRLEDIEAIKDVTARYAAAVNRAGTAKPSMSAPCPPPMPRTSGGKARTWASARCASTRSWLALLGSTAMADFSMHSFLNPVITVDGDGATGRWLLWIASTIDADPRAVYMSSDMTYTRTADGWRIQSVRMHFGILLHHI